MDRIDHEVNEDLGELGAVDGDRRQRLQVKGKLGPVSQLMAHQVASDAYEVVEIGELDPVVLDARE